MYVTIKINKEVSRLTAGLTHDIHSYVASGLTYEITDDVNVYVVYCSVFSAKCFFSHQNQQDIKFVCYQKQWDT